MGGTAVKWPWKRKTGRAPLTHDYTQFRGWGHDIVFVPRNGNGKWLEGSLWSSMRVDAGDYLVIPVFGGSTRYRITEVRPCLDPWDMYHFTAKFAPRKDAP